MATTILMPKRERGTDDLFWGHLSTTDARPLFLILGFESLLIPTRGRGRTWFLNMWIDFKKVEAAQERTRREQRSAAAHVIPCLCFVAPSIFINGCAL